MHFLESVGQAVLRVFEEFGRFFQMLGRTAAWAVRPPYDIAELLRQMVRVGWDSIPVVFLTTLFTGMVLALQTYNGFARFHAESFIGSVVALSLTRELAPVLTALMVTGRVGSAMAAELGSMRVTEQIDALTALGTEPVQYLVVPRVISAIAMLPLLVIMGDAVGMYGGYLVAVQLLGANPGRVGGHLVSFPSGKGGLRLGARKGGRVGGNFLSRGVGGGKNRTRGA